MKHPKLIIQQSPSRNDDDLSRYAAVINVSDSICKTFECPVPSFWFPIHETHSWGYAPFYGAAKVVDRFRDSDKPIMIHCHAGANRSPSVAFAIHASDGLSDLEIDKMYPIYGHMSEIYLANVKKGCIFRDTISMPIARHAHPEFAIIGLLQSIRSPNVIGKDFKQWAQCK